MSGHIKTLVLFGLILCAYPASSMVVDYSVLFCNAQDQLPTDQIKDTNYDDVGGYFIATDEGCFWYLKGTTKLLEVPAGKSYFFKRLFKRNNGSLLAMSDDAIYTIQYNEQGPILNLLLSGGKSLNDTLPYYPKSIFEDVNDNIWISDNCNVFVIRDNIVKKYDMGMRNHTLSYERSFLFLPFNNGRFAILSHTGFLYSYLPNEDRFQEEMFIKGAMFHAAVKLRDDSYLLSSGNGLKRLYFDKQFEVEELEQDTDLIYSCFERINDKHILGGTWSQGVHVLSINEQQVSSKKIDDNSLNGIHQVRTAGNNDFIASSNNGIILFKKKEFVSTSQHLNNDIIDCVVKDNRGSIYVSKGNAIYKSDHGSVFNEYLHKNTSLYTISDMHVNNDSLFIGTADGNVSLEYLGKTIFNIKVSDYIIEKIVKDKYGFYWIKSHYGLYQLNPHTKTVFNRTEELGDVTAGTISLDVDSSFMVGTNSIQKPLLLFNYEKNIFEPKVASFHSNENIDFHCKALLVSGDSIIVGTSKGCYILKNDTLEQVYLGIYNFDEIKSVAIDKRSNLWLSIKHGLLKYTKNEVFLFNMLTGMPSKTIGSNGLIVDDNDNVFIGTNNGLAVFNSESSVVKSTTKPIVYIKSLNALLRDDYTTLNIESDQYNILDLYCPQLPHYSTRFRYKFVGEDTDEWVQVDNTHQIILSSLRGGDHQIFISAKGTGLLEWSEPLIINITANKPWYLRWYSIAFILISIYLILAAFFYFRYKKTNVEKEKLERKVRTRTEELRASNAQLKEINATKDKFLSIIAHDLRTPFNSLVGIAEFLYQSYYDIDDERRKELISSVYEASQTNYRLLDNLLLWSRVQSGNFILNPKVFLLNDLVVQNIELAQYTASIKNIQIKTTGDSCWVNADYDMIDTVLRNLISNAIKFSATSSTVQIEMTTDKEHVTVKIIDQGIGISYENLSQIRNKNSAFTSLGTNKEKGTGFGLSICKEFLAINEGKLGIESEIGEGSIFSFTLPSGKNLV